MATPDGKAPILESAARGVAFLRENWQAAGVIALAAAGVSVAITLLAAAAPVLTPFLVVADYFVRACAYAALLSLALGGAPLAPQRVLADGARVFGAMSVIGFFLFIVCVVMALPSLVILSSAFAPFQSRIEAMGSSPDPEVMSALVMEAVTADPFPFLLVGFIYLAVWLLLTSRLYLAAPATVANGKVVSFDTWPWTKGNMLRILAARLTLLLPAAIIVLAVQRFAGAVFGVNTFDLGALTAFAGANLVGYALLQFVSEAAHYFVLAALEAGLSAQLFLRLRGAVPAKP